MKFIFLLYMICFDFDIFVVELVMLLLWIYKLLKLCFYVVVIEDVGVIFCCEGIIGFCFKVEEE